MLKPCPRDRVFYFPTFLTALGFQKLLTNVYNALLIKYLYSIKKCR